MTSRLTCRCPSRVFCTDEVPAFSGGNWHTPTRGCYAAPIVPPMDPDTRAAPPAPGEPVWTTTDCPHCGGEVDGIRVLTEAEIGRAESGGGTGDGREQGDREDSITRRIREAREAGFREGVEAAARKALDVDLPWDGRATYGLLEQVAHEIRSLSPAGDTNTSKEGTKP